MNEAISVKCFWADINRSGKYTSCFIRLQKYSTVGKKRNDTPIKYTTTVASKVLIAENLKFIKKEEVLWYQPYVVAGSLIIFLVYFCILREENDIDEILKGNPEYKSDYANFIDLQIRLHYCQQNNLPTEDVEAKLEEYKHYLE